MMIKKDPIIQIPISALMKEQSNGVYTLIGNELSRIGSLSESFPESIILVYREGQDGPFLVASHSLARGKHRSHGTYVFENDDGTVLYSPQKVFASRQAMIRKANEKIKKIHKKGTSDPRGTSDGLDAIPEPHVTPDDSVSLQGERHIFLEEKRYRERGKEAGIREVMRVPSE